MTEKPVSNVVLNTTDSLRVDAICAYDETRHPPVLEGNADRESVFVRASAGSNWTRFLFPSVMTSQPVSTGDGQIGVRKVPMLPTVEAWLQLLTAPVRRRRSWVRGDADDQPFLDTSRMFDVEHPTTWTTTSKHVSRRGDTDT